MNAQMVTTRPTSFAPTTLAEAMEFSKLIATSGFVPQEYRGKPADILVCLQMGAELGLSPLAALQSISVINGKPNVWGDGAIALVQASGLLEDHDEGVRGEGDARVGFCRMKRKGRPTDYIKTFSVSQAKEAGLWGRNVWKGYPDVMLVARARSACMRAGFPDVLKGLITREEAVDYPPEDEQVENTPPTSDLPWAERASARAAAPQIEAKSLPRGKPAPFADPDADEPSRGTPDDQLEATLRASLQQLGVAEPSVSVTSPTDLSLPASDVVSDEGSAAPFGSWATGDVAEPILINARDRKRIHACRSEGGHSIEEAKQWLSVTYGIESTAEIERDWLATICKRLSDTAPLL